MKRLLPVLMGFALLLLSSTEGWSLPPCPGSPTSDWKVHRNWTDCIGTVTAGSGYKYVGEWKDSRYHGQGTLTFADGRRDVGEFKYGKFHGKGTRYNADGTVYQEGIFEKGKLSPSNT